MSANFITLKKNSIITMLFSFNDRHCDNDNCHYTCFISGSPVPINNSYFRTTKDVKLVFVDPEDSFRKGCKNGEIFSSNIQSREDCNRKNIIDMLDYKNESGPPDGYISNKDFSFIIFGSSNFVPVSYDEAYRLYK